jgi:hypothetical protein
MIDQEGKRTEVATKVFNFHDDTAFAQGFAKLVKNAYRNLFELHGEDSWDLDANSLITFFRSTDGTTAIVGRLQAGTFQLLAAFSGHGDMPTPRSGGAKAGVRSPKEATPKHKDKQKKAFTPTPPPRVASGVETRNFGLTVRIEINLPADGDQETYNRIFKSIRANLLNE